MYFFLIRAREQRARERHCASREKKFILLVWLLPSLCSGIKLHTRKINFFFPTCTITINTGTRTTGAWAILLSAFRALSKTFLSHQVLLQATSLFPKNFFKRSSSTPPLEVFPSINRKKLPRMSKKNWLISNRCW